MRSGAILLTAVFFVAAADPAYAYIDPGSGSALATVVIGFFAAIGYTLRKSFYRVKDAVSGLFNKHQAK